MRHLGTVELKPVAARPAASNALTLAGLLCLALLTIGLTACKTLLHHPSAKPKSQSQAHHSPEYLDPVTAASVTTVSEPIIFARAHQDVSANSRQYATVAAASVNRSGRYDYLLLVYVWSTVDPRLGADVHPGQNLILLADDRAIRLPRDGRTLKEAGISKRLHAPLHARGQPRLYRTDKATLQFIARASRLRLQLEGDEDARPFEVWADARKELGQFAAN